MRTLENRHFLCCAVFFLIYHLIARFYFSPAYLAAYLDDVLALPIICTLVLTVHRVLIFKTDHETLPISHLLFILIFISVLFEGLLPIFKKDMISDPVDIIFYTLGAIYFHWKINIPIEKS